MEQSRSSRTGGKLVTKAPVHRQPKGLSDRGLEVRAEGTQTQRGLWGPRSYAADQPWLSVLTGDRVGIDPTKLCGSTGESEQTALEQPAPECRRQPRAPSSATLPSRSLLTLPNTLGQAGRAVLERVWGKPLREAELDMWGRADAWGF